MKIVVWGGGLLENRKPEDLKRFNKHKKQKEIIIGSIIAIVAIIGGISLIASFAMYEEKATFDVLKGTIPDFRKGKGDYNLIALTVNGEKTSTVPPKGTYSKIDVKCDNEATGEWDATRWGLFITSGTVPVSCTVDFELKVGSVLEYNYTGDEQEFIVPFDGKYKLEVWGASGGTVEGTIPGYGGYATGDVNLSQGETLHIYIGGTTTDQTGGYNGGGKGGSGNGQYNYGGGGATHIALATGLLSELENQQTQILIVAGGGGAGVQSIASIDVLGGAGGGIKGNDSANFTNSAPAYYGTGGSQTEAGADVREKPCGSGSFGKGGDFCNYGYGGAGGGGGFYGGGGGSRGHAGGGGGSGYIGNERLTNKEMWCYKCEESELEKTRTHTTENVSGDAVSQNAKQGSGYAKITYLGQS